MEQSLFQPGDYGPEDVLTYEDGLGVSIRCTAREHVAACADRMLHSGRMTPALVAMLSRWQLTERGGSYIPTTQ